MTINKYVLHVHLYTSYFVIFSLWKRMGRFVLKCKSHVILKILGGSHETVLEDSSSGIHPHNSECKPTSVPFNFLFA